LFNFKVIHW